MFERIITSMPARCMEAIQARTASSGAWQDFGARVEVAEQQAHAPVREILRRDSGIA